MEVLNALSELGTSEAVLYLRVASIHKLTAKNGSPYLDLVLADCSGSLGAKLWSDRKGFDLASSLETGEAVKVLARRGNYQGKDQIDIGQIRPLTGNDNGAWDPDLVYGKGYESIRNLIAKKLVMDIETAPLFVPGDLPDKLQGEVERVAKDREWPTDKVLGLNPLFSRVVSIAVGDADAEGGHVLFAPPETELDALTSKAEEWLVPMPEPEMLAAFWTLSGFCEILITYNGRGFDLPFLRTRSAILEVPVTRDFVSQPPYALAPHLDLYQVLTGGRRGAGPMNLDAACFAFGIESPKGAMDGSQVAPAFLEGRFEEIARYNLADVDATRSLYRRLEGPVLNFLS